MSPAVERALSRGGEAAAAAEEEAEAEEVAAERARTGGGGSGRIAYAGRVGACAWLCARVRQIEARSGLLDHAITLAEIGSESVAVFDGSGDGEGGGDLSRFAVADSHEPPRAHRSFLVGGQISQARRDHKA